jgi:hypothetical protein
MDKIESYISLLAGVLIVVSQFVFIAKVWNGKTTPSLFSWIGWAILIGQSFLAQYFETGWEWALVGIGISSLGCILISIIAIIRNNYSLKKTDWVFLVLGLSCVLVQILFKSAFITTVFAMIADFILGIPTFIKTYRDPSSESKSPWLVSVISWALTMTIAYDRGVEIWIFPLYLLLFCLVMVMLTLRKTRC